MLAYKKRKHSDITTNPPEKKARGAIELFFESFGSDTDTTRVIMFCWGSTLHGELGLGGVDQDHIVTPHKLSFNQATNVTQVACGDNHTMMLTKSGEVFSCGNNDHGQLGHTRTRTKPERVDGLEAYSMSMVSCGGSHTLAFNDWGQLFGWGSDAHGQLALTGDAQTTPKIVRGLATAHVIQVVCGQTHSLALTNGGELYAWGGNGHGQLGVGRRGGSERSPVVLTALKGVPIAFIACGAYHCFAVSKSGAVFGWGCNSEGQLGLNDTETRLLPTQIITHRTLRIKYISCGEDFSAFLSADGGVFTCGGGKYGQLGHGSPSNELLPRKIMELMGSTVTQISCGRRHTLALVPSRGHVYAFGLGGSGQLGTKKECNAATPQVVVGPWVSPNGKSMISNPEVSDSVIVTNVFSGGHQCFVTVARSQDNIEPDDRRFFKDKTQILTITASKVSQCRMVKPEDNVDQDIFTYLEVVFRNIACFNSSFLLSNDEHYCCSSRNHGIDIRKAQNVFDEIAKIENEAIKDLIWDGVTEGLIPSMEPNPTDSEALRLYLTLPLYHQFDNPKHTIKLQGAFAKKMCHLAYFPHRIVGTWWKAESSEYFERLVRIYKNVVSHHLQQVDSSKPKQRIFFDESMVHSLNLLGVLNVLNHAVEELRVPYDTFNIPELSDYIDLRVDYIEWLTAPESSGSKLFFCDYPFLFDAQAKTSLLQVDQSIQMQAAMSQSAARAAASFLFSPSNIITQEHFLCLNVCRDNLVQTTIHQLMLHSHDSSHLKKPLKVKFLGEEAEDGGGVRKEFFLLIMKEVLDPKFGMFKDYEETRTIWFNEVCFEDDIMYSFIGCLCGLAIYNFTIIDLPFPLVLYKKLLGEKREKVSYHDLKGLSPTLYRSLQDLLDYPNDDVEDVFCLNFEISREVYGEVKSIELKEGGSKIPVTQKNKQAYVDLHADYILNKSIATQFNAFMDGFNKVCGGRVLELFHSHELMALVVGNENYDWNEFEATAEYRGVYSAKHETIKLFWEVFHELTHEEKKMFLLFLTGSDRIPIQGMKNVKIFIQPVNDDKPLPVAHTCFNLLDLPLYKTKERLKYKLLQAIKQHQGFSLV